MTVFECSELTPVVAQSDKSWLGSNSDRSSSEKVLVIVSSSDTDRNYC